MSGTTGWSRVPGVARAVIACAAVAFTGGAGSLAAQEMEVPVSVQIPLFLKVVTFDRGHSADGRLTVAVAFQNGNRASVKAMEEAIEALAANNSTTSGLGLRIHKIDLDGESLSTALVRHGVEMLYVTPLRAVDIGGVASAARSAGAMTVTGVAQYVTLGLAVGVRRIGDKPKLMVNLRQSRLEGTDFSAEFLKLAQVIK